MPAVISISNLIKICASGLQALKRINPEIRKGKMFALLTPDLRVAKAPGYGSYQGNETKPKAP